LPNPAAFSPSVSGSLKIAAFAPAGVLGRFLDARLSVSMLVQLAFMYTV
jgi:hypothetical protein